VTEVAAVQSLAGAITGQAPETLSAGQTALELLPGQALFIKGLVAGSMAMGHQMQAHVDQAGAQLDEALTNARAETVRIGKKG
jgi:hypothetical protein